MHPKQPVKIKLNVYDKVTKKIANTVVKEKIADFDLSDS